MFSYHSVITSIQNQRIKDVRDMVHPRQRKTSGLFLIEGFAETSQALSAGISAVTLYHCPELAPPDNPDRAFHISLPPPDSGLEIIRISRAVMEKISYREHPDELLLVARQPDFAIDTFSRRIHTYRKSFKQSDVRGQNVPLLILVAEHIEKPGNIGALLRSADAAGADGCILCDGRTDLSNPNVARASKGIICSLPCAEADNETTKSWIEKEGLDCISALVDGKSSIWDLQNMLMPKKGYAVILGSEHKGLSPQWRGQMVTGLTIPMFGQANSLNVAQAGTLILYELRRILNKAKRGS